MRWLLVATLLIPFAADARPKRPLPEPKGGAGPKGKAGGACGAKVMPLVAGNQWTYVAIPAPQPPTDQIKRLSPTQPKTIQVTVKTVEAKGGEYVATLEEKLTIDRTKDEKKPQVEEYTYTSTINCTDKKFNISPNSFFFAGEPGGYLGLEIDKLDRVKGTSWQLTKGSIGEAGWGEDLVMHWKRLPVEGSDAKLGSGKIELERRFTPQDPEPVSTKPGKYNAEKVGLITTGRVTLEGGSPNAKPMELPAGWFNTLWIAENVGVVQVLNNFSHMYQLTAVTLK